MLRNFSYAEQKDKDKIFERAARIHRKRIKDLNICLKGQVKIITKRYGIYNLDDMQAVIKVQ